MTKLRRSTAICCLFVGVLAVAATSRAQTRPAIAKLIAKSQGLDSFDQIEAIRYTFNLDAPGVNLARSWVWHPKTDEVSYEGKGKDGKPVKVTYVRSQLERAPADVADEIDPAFVNDQYNLLFPLHVYWDDSADVRDLGMQKLPSGQGSGRRVAVKYPSEGGDSPGDTWELYLAPDNRVEELVFHRGGPKKPSLFTAPFLGYKKAGPLLVSTERPGMGDGKPLRITFSDVAVKLVGSDTWVNAQ